MVIWRGLAKAEEFEIARDDTDDVVFDFLSYLVLCFACGNSYGFERRYIEFCR